MKNNLIILCMTVFFFSCEDEDKPVINYSDIAAGDSVSEAVTYTSQPDSVLQSNCSRDYFASCGTACTYNLDLNQDDNLDYKIRLFLMMEGGFGDTPGFLTASVSMTPLKPGNNISVNNDLYSKVKIHQEGDLINKDMFWTDDTLSHNLLTLYTDGYTNEIPDYTYSPDSWAGKTDKYIGLQMIEASDTIYGWLRVDVQDVYKIVIKDFACRK